MGDFALTSDDVAGLNVDLLDFIQTEKLVLFQRGQDRDRAKLFDQSFAHLLGVFILDCLGLVAHRCCGRYALSKCCKILMHKLDCDGALANGGGASLDGVVADIAGYKDCRGRWSRADTARGRASMLRGPSLSDRGRRVQSLCCRRRAPWGASRSWGPRR